MNILGLHFGLDAGASVVKDGRVVCHVVRERRTRVKHAMTLDLETIERALSGAGLSADDIDFCAITSTQNVELIIDQPERLKIALKRHPNDTSPSTLDRVIRAQGVEIERLLKSSLLATVYDEASTNSLAHKAYRDFYPECRSRKREDIRSTGWLDDYLSVNGWERKSTLAQLAITNAGAAAANDELRGGFHLPVSIELDGRSMPGCFLHHHLCHAASSFYQSGFTRAMILTHDGFSNGAGYHGGMYYYGDGRRLTPLAPHHLAVGVLYDVVGYNLGLGDHGTAGKLMGLAAWGKPRFFDRRFVGNWYDAEARFKGHYANAWLAHCRQQAGKMGYDRSAAAVKERMTDPINVDIAASTQKLFEETMLAAVEALGGMAHASALVTENLCLSGGAALNCPANSRIAREGPFARVFVEPACDDSGLAIGAALAAYHNVLGQERTPAETALPATAYLGAPPDDAEIAAALTDIDPGLTVQAISDAPERAARDIAANRVVGWFEGRSEIGPRALGHRSILADARDPANWQRVNRIKGREAWRPFAPAVLETEAADWFVGAPLPSPYMLFSATVRSSAVPAITHRDGSARLQTVDESCGDFFHLLRAFYVLTKVPLVMNTSFNGPGEPIVETPADALRFFAASELDALYLGGYRVVRRAAAKAAEKAPAKKADVARSARPAPARARRAKAKA